MLSTLVSPPASVSSKSIVSKPGLSTTMRYVAGVIRLSTRNSPVDCTVTGSGGGAGGSGGAAGSTVAPAPASAGCSACSTTCVNVTVALIAPVASGDSMVPTIDPGLPVSTTSSPGVSETAATGTWPAPPSSAAAGYHSSSKPSAVKRSL